MSDPFHDFRHHVNQEQSACEKILVMLVVSLSAAVAAVGFAIMVLGWE